jgi:hypothetical protein
MHDGKISRDVEGFFLFGFHYHKKTRGVGAKFLEENQHNS